MLKRIALLSVLLSAFASSNAFAQWPTGAQNGPGGISWWIWILLVVVLVVVVFVLKGRKK